MTDIKGQWKNYMELGELMDKGELTKEEFEKQISAFSFFLSEINQDYHYNATYLPNYAMDFLHFLECFHKKYPLTERIFAMAAGYSGVTLIIDRYWQQESICDEEKRKIFVTHKVHIPYERKQICDDELLIECSVLCETKRFIYHSKIGTDVADMQHELQSLEEFLNAKSSSENRKKEK